MLQDMGIFRGGKQQVQGKVQDGLTIGGGCD